MKQQGLAFFENTGLTILAMFLFLSVFVGIVFWVYRKSGKQYYQRMAEIPLKKEPVTPRPQELPKEKATDNKGPEDGK